MNKTTTNTELPATAGNFIRTIIENDLSAGKHQSIVTRFPPEPNGYLHIGHAKAICLNFGVARDYQGQCNLRFDDTNPEKESDEYVRAIQEDIRWLGFQWQEPIHFASDYFEILYQYAVELIQQGLAYVCDLTMEEIRAYRGTLTEAGRNSPYRDRSIADNLDLFQRMKAGEFDDGSRTLRLKIDMGSPNLNLRDPIIYRIRRVHHHRTGDQWCIYPMYDYTHCISDALERVTHSLCSLEFEDHRPLYDWVLDHISIDHHPRQYEFSRLELLYTLTSKRKLNRLVTEGHVAGWDDPRMPTISGMRRRGYTPEGLKLFAQRIGISKSENIVDMNVLEGAVREELEHTVPRVIAVIDPLRVVLTNFESGVTGSRSAPYHPQQEKFGERELPLSREIYIERSDFIEEPPKGWQRLVPGGEVRLRYSYIIRCDQVIKDEQGNIIELQCSIDHDTLGKNPEGRKVKGVIHWIAPEHSLPVTVRLYDRLFTEPRPDAVRDELGQTVDFVQFINPDSLTQVSAYVEPVVFQWPAETRCQFERLGYFVTDRYDHQPGVSAVFNRVVSLKDTWKS